MNTRRLQRPAGSVSVAPRSTASTRTGTSDGSAATKCHPATEGSRLPQATPRQQVGRACRGSSPRLDADTREPGRGSSGCAGPCPNSRRPRRTHSSPSERRPPTARWQPSRPGRSPAAASTRHGGRRSSGRCRQGSSGSPTSATHHIIGSDQVDQRRGVIVDRPFPCRPRVGEPCAQERRGGARPRCSNDLPRA